MSSEDWFESWFNTSYYHKLYAHRDDTEAQLFISNVLRALPISPKCKLLDLACGRGRHSIFLNDNNCDVIGLDLSEKNIEFAKTYESERLKFEVGDMREEFGNQRFDYIFNLFTSFGYFQDKEDNSRACQSIHKALKPGGKLVLDFMNVNKVKLGLVKEEIKLVEGVEFHIERFIRSNKVVKKISFQDKGQDFNYEEQVQLLELSDFEELFAKSDLKIENTYGDFNLKDFDPINSERLILFASRKL